MNYNSLLYYIGYPFNDEPYCQLWLSLFVLIYINSKTVSDIVRHSLLMVNGIYLIFILKEKLKSKRPLECKSPNNIEYCPESYDIPSGHCFLAVYWLLVLYRNKIDYTLPLMFYLGVVPFTRYMSGVHTTKAVFVGSVLGCVWFLILNIMEGVLF